MTDFSGSSPPRSDLSLAEWLNRGCACRALDPERLREQLEREPELAGLSAEIARTRPQMFSATMVFITPEQKAQVEAIVHAVEDAVARPLWQEQALELAPEIARHDPGARGVFFGYDFHVGPDGVRLIEINTNAGGAALNAVLAHAQSACCPESGLPLNPVALEALEAQWLTMFDEEWRLAGGEGRPGRIAIVDDEPAAQYLYPEFCLFQKMFERAGIATVIADAAELRWDSGRLTHQGEPIDLVYNRLTDFALADPAHAALRAAYLADAVVLTPHPRAHALYADKRLFAWLADPRRLAALDLSEASRAALLAGVPPTRWVSAESADALWAARRELFFKPSGGYGSRAAYRGDKLTRRVWGEILAGGYVAQQIVSPGQRLVCVDGGESCSAETLKFDLRAYVWKGRVQLFAARLYSGQTTNFRTPGGGFAPVFVIDHLLPGKTSSATLER